MSQGSTSSLPRMSVLLGCTLLLSCDSCDMKVPAVVASSRYIEYHTWAYPGGLAEEGAVVCMDDKLAEMDRFVEFVASALEVDVPAEPIHYVWVPQEQIDSETWTCPADAAGCYDPNGPGGHGIVYSSFLDLFHELVHAVEIPALGRSHPVFEEGMANYLSTAESSIDELDEFPAKFKAELGLGRQPAGKISMHFVGALISRGGLKKYKAFRRQVADGEGLPEFVAAYEAVYGGSFEEFLVDASADPIIGIGANSLCAGAPTVRWDLPGALETTLPWACGDGATFGIAETFGTTVAINVPQEGYYRLTISGAGGWPVFSALLDTCPIEGEGSFNVISAEEDYSAPGILPAGHHTLTVWMSPGPEVKGEILLLLE